MHNSTLRDTLSDRMAIQAAAREARYIAAQEAARLQAEKVAAIRAAYTFTRYDFRTFYKGDLLIQAAMLVENPDDVNDRFIVTCSVETGEEVWTVQTPPFKKDLGTLFIAAVQARLAANRKSAGKNSGSRKVVN